MEEYFQEIWTIMSYIYDKNGNVKKNLLKAEKLPQTDLKPSSKPIRKSWPTIWNIGGTVPKFTNLQYPPATPKSHDTRFQKPTN